MQLWLPKCKIHVLVIKMLSTHLWVNDVSEADMVVREDTWVVVDEVKSKLCLALFTQRWVSKARSRHFSHISATSLGLVVCVTRTGSVAQLQLWKVGAVLHWRWLCSTFEKKEYDFLAKQTSCKGTIHYIISHHILGLSRIVDYYSTVLFLTL